MRHYEYRCYDYSLLTPTFKKWLVAPLLPLIPWAIPANIITIFSNMFVYAGFALALLWTGPMSRLLIGLSLLIYLIGDHLDGMQAKRTKTGSALGEFCDHYLDAFNNGIILFTVMLVFQITNPIYLVVVLAPSYLAHVSIFYEQFKTGWLTFEKLGSLEGVLFLSLLVCAGSLEPVYTFLTLTTVLEVSISKWIFILSALGAVLTFVNTIFRIPSRSIHVWIFVASLIIISVSGYFTFSLMELFFIITLYASLYLGSVMKGHLVDGLERLPDIGTPVVVLLLLFVPTQFGFEVVAFYLFVRIIALVYSTFSELKRFWVWSNPKL